MVHFEFQPAQNGYPRPKNPLSPFQRRPHVPSDSLSGRCGQRVILPDPRRMLDPTAANTSAPYGAFPWQADVAVAGEERDQHLCSGVVVSERFVLAVASCLTSQPIRKLRIVAGQHNLNKDDEFQVTR